MHFFVFFPKFFVFLQTTSFLTEQISIITNMRKQIAILSAVLLMGFGTLLTSCNTKMHAVNQLERFSYELRDHSANYSVREWEDAAQRFVEIRKNISKHELDYTAEEKARIGQLEGKCAGYMARGMKEGFFDKVKGVAGEIKGILKGILNAVTD